MHYPDKKAVNVDVSIDESKNKEAIDFVDNMKYGVKQQLLGFRAIFSAIDELINGDMTLSPMNDAALKEDKREQSKESIKAVSSNKMLEQAEESKQQNATKIIEAQNSKTIESELLRGTVFYDIPDGNNIDGFKAALVISGKTPHRIVFSDSGVGRAAKYLLLYVVTKDGSYDLGDVKTACKQVGLKTSGSSKDNPHHVRNAMRQALKNAAELRNIKIDKKKDNAYHTNLAFQRISADTMNDDAVEIVAPKEDIDALEYGLNYQKPDPRIPE